MAHCTIGGGGGNKAWEWSGGKGQDPVTPVLGRNTA